MVFTAISSALYPSFQKDQDILVLPLDLLHFDTHENLTNDVIRHFGKVNWVNKSNYQGNTVLNYPAKF